MKGAKTTARPVSLPKVPALPGGTPKGGANLHHGFSVKRQLRKGTEFGGMDPVDSGISGEMSDYARVLAARQ